MSFLLSFLTLSCDSVANVAFPAADEPSLAEAKALAACDAEALFYGIGRPIDRVQARKCAYAQRAAGNEGVFAAEGVLMMVYASGDGAAQNLDLAMRLACQTAFADAEKSARLADLEARKREPEKARAAFDICDHVTSGFMSGHCAAHEQRMKQAARKARQAMAGERLPDASALHAAAAVFFTAREQNEVDLSGSARASFMIRERAALEDAFADALDRLAEGVTPKAASLESADKALNTTYSRVMRTEAPEWGTVRKDGIKKTQRAWIKYRDAFVALAKKANADGEAWSAWLTEQRTKSLQELLLP